MTPFFMRGCWECEWANMYYGNYLWNPHIAVNRYPLNTRRGENHELWVQEDRHEREER